MNETKINSILSTTGSPTLIFLHIPKTGGRTFYNILIRQFSPSEIFNIERLSKIKQSPEKELPPYQFFSSILQKCAVENLREMANEEKRKIKCITQGHLAFGLHIYFPQKVAYLAFFRNPVNRTISTYYYLQRRPNHPFHYLAKGKDLKDYVRNEETSGQISNAQVRFLCGESGIPKKSELSEKDLELAKERLKKHFSFVGVTERFNESLICLKKIFGWKNIFYYKVNVSKNRPSLEEIPKDTLDIIREKNELDMKLYEFAQQLLKKSIGNYGPYFESDLRRLQKRLPVRGKLLYLKRIFTASPKMWKNKLLIELEERKAKMEYKKESS